MPGALILDAGAARRRGSYKGSPDLPVWSVPAFQMCCPWRQAKRGLGKRGWAGGGGDKREELALLDK